MKYNPKRDLPDFARELKTLSPSKLAEHILMKRNKKISSESVTMWFSRHPKVYDELSKELVDGLPTEHQEVDGSVFQNGSFQEVPSVKSWITYLSAVRRVKEKTLRALVGNLRQICTGSFTKLKIDFIADGKWCLKHPDRLNYQDALDFIKLLREYKIDPYAYAKTLKSFLVSKGITEGAKLLVGKPRGFGKYKDLFVSEDILDRMLDWIFETYGKEPYVADCLMYTKAFRINAVIKANIENMTADERITLYEKGLERKYGEKGKPVTKKPNAYLWKMMKEIQGDRQSGRLFSVNAETMAGINRDAMMHFCPHVLVRYPLLKPNHFWRHMFAQHMLRKTGWHTAKVAALGNWTEQALKESYGEPPEDVKAQWGEEFTIEHRLLPAQEVRA